MIDAGHDIVVNANQFEENNDGLRCVDSFNLTCNGNNFDDHLRHGVVIENTYGSVVSGNMIQRFGQLEEGIQKLRRRVKLLRV